jgi:hypothetical protein
MLIVSVRWGGVAAGISQANLQAACDAAETAVTEMSYGLSSLTATVTPWSVIDTPSSLAMPPPVYDDLLAAARSHGYEPDNYDVLVMNTPAGNQPSIGRSLALMPGMFFWAVDAGQYTVEGRVNLILHEYLHTRGLDHAHTAFTTNGAGTPAQTYTQTDSEEFGMDDNPITGSQVGFPLTLSSSNVYLREYGDDYAVMGSFYGTNPSHPSAPHKFALGWLQGRMATLTNGQSAVLTPRTAQTAGNKAAVMHVTATRSYWFEYITATGTDQFLDDGGLSPGVYVHAVDPYLRNPALIDTAPAGAGVNAGSTPFNDAGLQSGDSWTSPEGRTFTVSSVSASAATVAVT